MLTAFLPMAFLSAQNCEPDMSYADSVGVFPLPFDPVVSPDGGISECAVIGEPFDFVFTAAISDSINVTIAGNEVRLGLTKVKVNDVEGLPIGLNYICEPDGCEFLANTLGCAKITGVPTADNTPGVYELKIIGKAFFPDFPFEAEITFPGALAEGKYSLTLNATADDPCNLTSTNDVLKEKVAINVSPNPTSGFFEIKINAELNGGFDLYLMDLLGRSVERRSVKLTEGENNFSFDASQMANGMYFLVLQNGLGRVAQKVNIQH